MNYEGWYSEADEAFCTDAQVRLRGNDGDGPDTHGTGMVSAETGRSVFRTREANYMFRLSAFTQQLREWLEQDPSPVYPTSRRNEVLGMLEAGLPDLSVSRPRAQQDGGNSWGISVPGDPDHVVYVWLDALSNYLTVADWPTKEAPYDANANAVADVATAKHPHRTAADVHVIGKDILKFHCLYWPAFLMAAGLPLPSRVVAHGHWTIDGAKISKSQGGTVCPRTELSRFGAEPVRYFLMRRARLQDDADYASEGVVTDWNALVDTFGNLLSRACGKKVCPEGEIPGAIEAEMAGLTSVDTDLLSSLDGVRGIVDTHYTSGQVGLAIEAVLSLLRQTNAYYDKQAPWTLARDLKKNVEMKKKEEEKRKKKKKDPLSLSSISKTTVPGENATKVSEKATETENDQQAVADAARARLTVITYVTTECLRVAALGLSPVVPELADAVLMRLAAVNTNRGDRDHDIARGGGSSGSSSNLCCAPESWQRI